jgi:hypothetical protein
MKANTNNKNQKTSAKKKLIPAVSMFTISAVMLSTATYAWFTMSREVEVTGIKLTATTPEDIQISLGAITDSNDSDTNLALSTGTLDLTGTTVNEPAEIYDWSNTADVSAYYAFGKLIPASSTTGENIYFTPDAEGVGKTVKTDAKYYTAATKTTSTEEKTVGSLTSTNVLMATAHTFTSTEKPNTTDKTGTWATYKSDGTDAEQADTAYKTATAWNGTNDDGYYVDIPVWLRTSSTVAQNIYVTGYVTKGANTTDTDTDDVLYQSVRVAILKGDGSADGGCLTLADGANVKTDSTARYFANTTEISTAGYCILDSENYNKRTDGLTESTAVYAIDSVSTLTYKEITQNKGDSVVATLAAGKGTDYGDATKLIIRVWIEGEDGDCWNENAGQDWNISLKFMKEALTSSSDS